MTDTGLPGYFLLSFTASSFFFFLFFDIFIPCDGKSGGRARTVEETRGKEIHIEAYQSRPVTSAKDAVSLFLIKKIRKTFEQFITHALVSHTRHFYIFSSDASCGLFIYNVMWN